MDRCSFQAVVNKSKTSHLILQPIFLRWSRSGKEGYTFLREIAGNSNKTVPKSVKLVKTGSSSPNLLLLTRAERAGGFVSIFKLPKLQLCASDFRPVLLIV